MIWYVYITTNNRINNFCNFQDLFGVKNFDFSILSGLDKQQYKH